MNKIDIKTDDQLVEVLRKLTGAENIFDRYIDYYSFVLKNFQSNRAYNSHTLWDDILAWMPEPTRNFILGYIQSREEGYVHVHMKNKLSQDDYKDPEVQIVLSKSSLGLSQLRKMKPLCKEARENSMDYFMKHKTSPGRWARGHMTWLGFLKPTEDEWANILSRCPDMEKHIPKRKRTQELDLISKLG
jgi:hypothetical protein